MWRGGGTRETKERRKGGGLGRRIEVDDYRTMVGVQTVDCCCCWIFVLLSAYQWETGQ